MPRIRQYEAKYAEEDFRTAIFTAMVKSGMECSIRQLAERAGLTQSLLNTKIRHKPEALTVAEFQKIVPIICPGIREVLSLLGYSSQSIKKFKEE